MNDQLTAEPQPVTPMRLAEEWVVLRPYRGEQLRAAGKLGFIAGYRANAERSADFAQRLSLAEEALKRHGFELGVVQDVVTWVPMKQRARIQPCGCVTCICGDPERCHGCGAKNCDKTNCVFDGTDKCVVYSNAPSYDQLIAENVALKTAAADYAKAAEANAALVEKLTKERDESRELVTASCGYATEALDSDYIAISAGTRENVAQSIRILRRERDELRQQLAEANTALTFHNHRTEEQYNEGQLGMPQGPCACVTCQSFYAELEKEQQGRVAKSKELAEVMEWLEKERAQAERLKVEKLEWQAVAEKMKEALERELQDSLIQDSINMRESTSGHTDRLIATLSTFPPTALLEVLEAAWKDGWLSHEHTPYYDKQADWLASETFKRAASLQPNP